MNPSPIMGGLMSSISYKVFTITLAFLYSAFFPASCACAELVAAFVPFCGSSLNTSPRFWKLSGAMRFLKMKKTQSQYMVLQISYFVSLGADRPGIDASMARGNWFHVLVHTTGEIFLGQLPASLVVGTAVGLDAFQITRNDVFAFSWADEWNVSPVHAPSNILV